MTQTNYAIDDANGNQLTAGLSPQTARRTAQRLADERNESVYLYAIPVSDDVDASEEIEPSEIEVDLGGPVGPRVTYGAHDEATVEAEIPEGWTVDWSNAVDVSTSGTHRIRYAAPLVQVASGS